MAIIDDWFDEETLLGIVPPDVFVRGASAVEAGAVRVLERSDTLLVTSVEAGEDEVRSEWTLAGEQPQFACSCGQATERPCEHLIASALATWPGEAAGVAPGETPEPIGEAPGEGPDTLGETSREAPGRGE